MSLIVTPSADQHSRRPLSQSMEDPPPEPTEKELEEEDEPEEDFSFVCLNPDDDDRSAPVFPLFNRDLLFSDDGDALRPPLRKVFVEEEETTVAATGPYCEWRAARTTATMMVAESSSSPGPSGCKKSNSTGFSKLWRFRPEPKLRSKSDGKDAFVFLSNHQSYKDNVERGRKSDPPAAPVSKHKSYLPYRHAGLFADVNSLTRNIHPF